MQDAAAICLARSACSFSKAAAAANCRKKGLREPDKTAGRLLRGYGIPCVSDELWAVIEPLVPPAPRRPALIVLPFSSPVIGKGAGDGLFDPVRLADTIERLRGTSRCGTHVEELSVWDNAAWHISQAVQTWIGRHDQTVKRTGRVRILVCRLPVKSPWLNPIEPHWLHSKRAIVELDRKSTSDQLTDRMHQHFRGKRLEPLHQHVVKLHQVRLPGRVMRLIRQHGGF